MAWFLQTPDGASPKLLKHILAEIGPAKKAGAAFAFASAQGVKLLAAEPAFGEFLKASEFTVIVGLDGITDTRAVHELAKLKKSRPNLHPKLFLHKIAGSIFHPKTMWLKTDKGGVIITGSGNLTSGGLKSNWEALAVEKLDADEMAEAEKVWDAWLEDHKKELLELDDPKAVERAKANKVMRSRIKKALKKTENADEATDEEIEAAEEVVEEVEKELLLNPVLIAEVPKSGGRWQQVNFDLKSYQEYFGVAKGTTRHVRFHQVHLDGTFGAPEERQGVAVKSANFRFEVGAAAGLAYPSRGHPVIVFEQTTEDDFSYILLMPGQPEHTRIQKYLDSTYERTNKKLRVQITAGGLRKAWPDCPFFK